MKERKDMNKYEYERKITWKNENMKLWMNKNINKKIEEWNNERKIIWSKNERMNEKIWSK